MLMATLEKQQAETASTGGDAEDLFSSTREEVLLPVVFQGFFRVVSHPWMLKLRKSLVWLIELSSLTLILSLMELLYFR